MREILLDKDQILESLTVEDVKKLLYSLGAEDIIDESENKDQLITNTICHNMSGGSMKLYYRPSAKKFYCFTGCHSTSVFDVVMQNFKLKGQELNLPQSIEYIASKMEKKFGFGFGFSLPDSERNSEPSEMDWMNRFDRKVVEYPEPEFHNEEILNVFSNIHHQSFLDDGISHDAMSFYNIKYYNRENAAIIPHRYYENGKICGIKMRNFDQYKIDAGYKYLPAKVQSKQYNFPSYSNIFSLWENKMNISRMKKVAIFESEKSVLQVETMFGRENNFSVALSGKNISSNQIKMLLETGIEECILCFDKDFDDMNDPQAKRMVEHILKIGRKLSPYIRVYTLFDIEGLLKKNQSPSDRGIETLKALMRNKQEILNLE